MLQHTTDSFLELLGKMQDFNPLFGLMRNVGKPYIPVGKLPRNLKRGKPKQCFTNSGEIAARGNEYRYVEGVAMRDDIGFPFHHAWLTDDDDSVAYDVTLRDPEAYHFIGISFTSLELYQAITETGRWGVFQDEMGYNKKAFDRLAPGFMEEHANRFQMRMEMLGRLSG